MPDDKEDLTPEQQQDAEYNSAWEEMGAAEAKAGKAEDTETPTPAAEDKSAATEDTATPEPGKSKDHGNLDSVEKALKDTKGELTRVQQEKAELKAQLEAATKTGTAEEVKNRLQALREKVDFTEYPELEPFFDGLVEENVKLAETVHASTAEKRQAEIQEGVRKAALETFNRDIKPKIVEVHADFEEIVNSEDYWKWVDQQKDVLPVLHHAATASSSPADINWALGEYKKTNADVIAAKAADAKKRQTVSNNARSLRGGGTPGLTEARKAANPDDYQGGWEEAGELLKREGLG